MPESFFIGACDTRRDKAAVIAPDMAPAAADPALLVPARIIIN